MGKPYYDPWDAAQAMWDDDPDDLDDEYDDETDDNPECEGRLVCARCGQPIDDAEVVPMAIGVDFCRQCYEAG